MFAIQSLLRASERRGRRRLGRATCPEKEWRARTVGGPESELAGERRQMWARLRAELWEKRREKSRVRQTVPEKCRIADLTL